MSEKAVFMKTFFLFDFNQDNILADLADTVPWNDVFTFSAWHKTESSRTGYDEGGDFAGSFIKFKVYRTAETAAGAGINNFFLPEFT